MEWMDNSPLNQTGVRLVTSGGRCCRSQCSWVSSELESIIPNLRSCSENSKDEVGQLFPTYKVVQRIQKMKWVSCPKTVRDVFVFGPSPLPLPRSESIKSEQRYQI